MKRVTGQVASAASVASVIAWTWNTFLPEHAMPAEVAGAMGGLVGPLVAWLVSWLPKPE